MLLTHRVLEHRARALVALLALALAALGLSACGGGGNGGGGGGGDARALLEQIFTGKHEMNSGRVDLRLRVDAQGDPTIQGPIELTVKGPFQAGEGDELPQFDLALEVRAQGQGFEAGLVSAGGKLFIMFGGTAYEAPPELVAQMQKSYAESRRESGSSGLDLAGIDPMGWLSDPQVEGTETAGGVEADHISAGLDVAALLDDVDELLAKVGDQVPSGVGAPEVPDSIPADVREQIEDAVKSARVEVWGGTDDHTLRKLTLALDIELPESAEGPSSLDIELTVELDELNEPQTIEAPASTRPLSELLGQLQGFLGGALGGSGLGSDSGSGSGSVPNIDEYTECLQDAAGDPEKAQECAKLLNP